MFYDQGIVPIKTAEPLMLGSAYHAGTAMLTAKRDLDLGVKTALDYMDEEFNKQKMILPEERTLHANNQRIMERMIKAQWSVWKTDAWTVLKPEVEFTVPVPGTEHHCHFIHALLVKVGYIDPNLPEKVCVDPRCWQPIRLRGKTDAVLSWNSLIWIMERKTSGMKQEIFWDQWYLSHQISGYVYGVRKATGLPINGVILEKAPKPARNQNPLTFDYSPEREPYLRSEADLQEFEDELIAIATDYEAAAASATPHRAFYRNPKSCCNYNRRCHFHATCKRGTGPQEGEFGKRELDYVELAYYDILGLPVPPLTNTHPEGKEIDADA